MRRLMAKPVSWPISVLLAIANVFCCGFAWAQPPVELLAPTLQIDGPTGQTLFVTTRYYDDGSPSKTLSQRFVIGESMSLGLESGHNAVRVYLAIPTEKHVAATLKDGETVIRRLETTKVGVYQLACGKTSENEAYQPPRTFLDSSEREFALRFLSAVEKSSTREIVSTLPLANIEWQTLNAYCRSLNLELGNQAQATTSSAEPVKQLDGWLGWEGSLGARVLSGPAQFELGEVRFTLMIIDNKLVDLSVASREMTDDWFDGFDGDGAAQASDSELAKYIELSELLARRIIGGEPLAAHELFSARFRHDISVDSIRELSKNLQHAFGSEISKIEFLGTQLGIYDAESGSKPYHVLLAIDFANGKQAIASSQYIMPCRYSAIGRAELAAVDIHQSLPSFAAPELELAKNAINILCEPETNEVRAQEFVALLHPDMLPLFQSAELPLLASRIQRFGTLTHTPDWRHWKYQTNGSNLSAVGPLNFSTGLMEAQVDFCEGKLIGVTMIGSQLAVSTLDLLHSAESAASQGKLFWEKLLQPNLPSAHEMLAAVFREKLPFEEFQSAIVDSNLGQPRELSQIELDTIRFSNRLERARAVGLTAIYLAHFKDGTFQPLQCEFSQASGNWELLFFTDNFQTTIPIPGSTHTEKILNRFLSDDPQSIIDITPIEGRDKIVEPILAAFLTTLRSSLSGKPASSELVAGAPATTETLEVRFPHQVVNARQIHTYGEGSRIESLAAEIETFDGRIPFKATLRFGQLQSFTFVSPPLTHFVGNIHSIECFESMGLEFIQQWMKPSETQLALTGMASPYQTTAALQQLSAQRDELVQQHGRFLLAALSQWQASDSKNEMTTVFEIEFEDQFVRAEIIFAVSAVDAKISSLKILP